VSQRCIPLMNFTSEWRIPEVKISKIWLPWVWLISISCSGKAMCNLWG
jgi:hypothetical protein